MVSRSYQDDRLASLKNPTSSNFLEVNNNQVHPRFSVVQHDVSGNHHHNTYHNRSNIGDYQQNHIANSQYINPNGSYMNSHQNYTPNYNNYSYANRDVPKSPYKSTYIDPNISATLGVEKHLSGIGLSRYDNGHDHSMMHGTDQHHDITRNVGEKLQNEADDKARVQEDVRDLKSKLQFENERNIDLERRNIEEIRDQKNNLDNQAQKHDEKAHLLHNVENEMARWTDYSTNEVFREFERNQSDNKLLKENFLQLRDMTNSRISELDSKLKGLEKMRDHEKDSYTITADTTDSEHSLIFDDLEKNFREVTRNIETKLNQLGSDEKTSEKTCRDYHNEIRAIGPKADQEARMLLDQERARENDRLMGKTKELEGRLNGTEEHKRSLIAKVEDYMRRMQDLDIKYRQDQNHKQADHTKFIQDLQHLAQQQKKYDLEQVHLEKELGSKIVQREKCEHEYNNLLYKLKDAKKYGLDTIDSVKRREELELEELHKIDQEHKQEESRLDEKNKRTKDELDILKTKYDNVLRQLKDGFTNTIEDIYDDFANYNKGSGRKSKNKHSHSREKPRY